MPHPRIKRLVIVLDILAILLGGRESDQRLSFERLRSYLSITPREDKNGVGREEQADRTRGRSQGGDGRKKMGRNKEKKGGRG